MRTILVGSLIVLWVFLTAGCGGGDAVKQLMKPNLAPATADVQTSGKTIQTNTAVVANDLAAAKAAVITMTDSAAQAAIVPPLDEAARANGNIEAEAQKLLGPILAQLANQSTLIAALQKQADDVQTDNAKLTKELADEKAKGMATLHWLLAILIVLGVLGLGASVFIALKVSFQSGLALAGASLMVICPAIFVLKFEQYLIWAGGFIILAVVAGICIAAYVAWKKGDLATHFAAVGQTLKTAVPAADLTKITDTLSAALPVSYQAEFNKLLNSGAIPPNPTSTPSA